MSASVADIAVRASRSGVPLLPELLESLGAR
jgi:hypothetical protein